MAAWVWDAFGLHVGDAIVTQPHAVVSVQIVVGFERPVTVEGRGVKAFEAAGVFIGANVRHSFRAARFAMLWVEPESDAGRRLRAKYTDIAALELPAQAQFAQRGAALLEGPGTCDAAWNFSRELLTAFAGELPHGGAVHPAVRRAVRLLDAQPDPRMPVRELAAQVGLSSSRLQHLFRETMGMPLRRYSMWQRLRRAVFVLARGGSATDAAHHAGFADSAHLTRVVKLMLGARPRDLLALRAAGNLTLRVCARPRGG